MAACAVCNQATAASTPESPEAVAARRNDKLPAISVEVSTERMSAMPASDMTTSATSAKKSTRPCWAEGKDLKVMALAVGDYSRERAQMTLRKGMIVSKTR